jgi:hypothetical protein
VRLREQNAIDRSSTECFPSVRRDMDSAEVSNRYDLAALPILCLQIKPSLAESVISVPESITANHGGAMRAWSTQFED